MKKIAMLIPLFLVPLNGCASTGSLESVELMTDADYANWKLYLQLGTKIGANQLLQNEVVSVKELQLAATALETARDQSVIPGTTELIGPALREAGLTNDEIELLLLVVENELISHDALKWLDPTTGALALSPRTKELLTIVAEALRSATVVTDEEVKQSRDLENKFGKFTE